MEIFGGFVTMASLVGFFLAVIWFVLPFVVLAVKGRTDRILDKLEQMDVRLAALEREMVLLNASRRGAVPPDSPPSEEPSPTHPE